MTDHTKPQPAVGSNTGSSDMGSRVAGGGMCADPLPMGKAVNSPPKPDKMPVAAGADDIHKKYQVACQLIRDLTDMVHEQSNRLAELLVIRQIPEAPPSQTIIGYAVIPGDNAEAFLASEAEARKHAEFLLGEEPDLYITANVVAILDSVELAPAWKNTNLQPTPSTP